MMDFLVRFGALSVELARLAGQQFVPDGVAYKGPISGSLEAVLRLHNEGRQEERDWEMTRLAFLARDLKRIEEHDAQLLERFRQKLRDPDLSRYFGTRHESATASALINCGLDFEYEADEAPDFLVRRGSGEAGLECSSIHLTQPKLTDVIYKVESAIRLKSEKPYASRTVALTIDTTNVHRVSTAIGASIFADPAFERAAVALRSSNLGALILTTLLLNKDESPPRLERNYRRVDHEEAHISLVETLDIAYPHGDVVAISDYEVPNLP